MTFTASSSAIHPDKANGDTILVTRSSLGIIYGVFDGAGASPFDSEASLAAAEHIAALAPSLRTLGEIGWECLLDRVTKACAADGTTTATLCHVLANEIECVSVGDSEAWLLGSELVELSMRQNRGRVGAHNFEPPTLRRVSKVSGTLYLASDGVHRYLGAEAVAGYVLAGGYASEIVSRVREATGALRDDSSVILVTL